MSLRRPPLDHDTKTTDFGGWEMPVEFDSIRTEHAAVREQVGKFDVSHMGEVTVSGPDAAQLCQRLTTNDVTALDPGEAQYAAITDERGVMLDDTVIYCLPESQDEEFLFIPNAGHDEQMSDRWVDHRDKWSLDATVTNRTAEYAMFAIQGPDAPELLGAKTAATLGDLGRFDVTSTTVAGADALVARTGYTGETGFETLVPWDDAQAVWDAIDCQPCGLGARDTLRIEMGFLLSGQDFHPESEPRTPLEAKIGFVVDLDTEFVGRDSLAEDAADGPAEQFVGVVLDERGVPRNGYEVQTTEGESIGTITSGTMSPTLGDPIALGYLPTEYADSEQSVQVVIRDEPKKAHTTTPPFLS
jgi:aminomethyltransferase